MRKTINKKNEVYGLSIYGLQLKFYRLPFIYLHRTKLSNPYGDYRDKHFHARARFVEGWECNHIGLFHHSCSTIISIIKLEKSKIIRILRIQED